MGKISANEASRHPSPPAPPSSQDYLSARFARRFFLLFPPTRNWSQVRPRGSYQLMIKGKTLALTKIFQNLRHLSVSINLRKYDRKETKVLLISWVLSNQPINKLRFSQDTAYNQGYSFYLGRLSLRQATCEANNELATSCRICERMERAKSFLALLTDLDYNWPIFMINRQ